MSRAVVVEQHGGPEVLDVREVTEPHAGPGQVRVRVSAAGLNPVDWKIAASPETAAAFGVTTPSGFGNDFAGVIDELGTGVTGFAVGDRVFGGARGHAVADHAVLDVGREILVPTPEDLDDRSAATLTVAGRTADAIINAIAVGEGDTLLVAGAAGGVGIFLVQLARLAGARVIGTGSPETAPFLRELGVDPVAYGPGLAERLAELAPEGITATADLHGVDTSTLALELGVPGARIVTVAGVPPEGTRRTGGQDAAPGALERIASLIARGELVVPIAERYPIERIREAVTAQKSGHVHGKIVITLD